MQVRNQIAARAALNESDLQEDSRTVAYECTMLVAAARLANVAAPESAERNAFIESFAVHCRNLIYFLYGHLDEIAVGGQSAGLSPPRSNDILATDFNQRWITGYRVPSAALIDGKKNADKQIAHITEERRGLNQPGTGITSGWDMCPICESIRDAFRDFLASAPLQSFHPHALDAIRSFCGTSPAGGRAQQQTGNVGGAVVPPGTVLSSGHFTV